MIQLQKFKPPKESKPTLLVVSEEKSIQLVGLRHPIRGVPSREIPAFWEKFSPYRGWLPGQVGHSIYGALLKSDDGLEGFDYFTAVEVSDFIKTSSDWNFLKISRQRYAIFVHRGHASELAQTQHTIFAHSLSALGLVPRRHVRNVPLFLERYDHTYDLRTGWGGIQVWVPLEDR